MEIPVINRIGDFDGGITTLQDPSFLSQAFSFSGAGKIHQAYGFWKWGALILAIAASFSTIINRIKILIIRIQNHYLIPSQPPLISHEDYSSDSESETSSSEDELEIEDEEEEEEDDDDKQFLGTNNDDKDYRVRGSSYYGLRRRRNNSLEDLFSSWSELKNGKSVVKLWDNLGFGLGLNLENNSRSCVSFYDANKDLNFFSIFGENWSFPAVSASSSSPAVVVSCETNVSGQLLKVWDTRVGCRIPQILAEWRPRLGRLVGTSGGGGFGEKVYLRDDVTGSLTVGDTRKVKSPFVSLTENDVDTWWDANGVIDGKVD